MRYETDCAGDQQDSRQRRENGHALPADVHRLPRSMRDWRKPVRNAVICSSAPSRVGFPKATEQSNGSGKIAPFGMTRHELSIHTGTSSTSGPACAT
jgi:hypothetical protein